MTSKIRNFVSSGNTSFKILSCSLFILLTLPASISPANENTIEYDTSVAGQIVPTKETVIEVRDEKLDIEFLRLPWDQAVLALISGSNSDEPLRVHVNATYRLFNPTGETLTPQIAFPIVRSGPEDHFKYIRDQFYTINQSLPEDVRRGVKSNVTLNGEPLPFEYVSFESLFEKERQKWAKEVRSWLSQWPDLLKSIDHFDESQLQIHPFTNLGLKSLSYENDNRNLWKKFGSLEVSEKDKTLLDLAVGDAWFNGPPEKWDLDLLSFLYSQLKPEEEDEVQKFQARWGVEPDFLNPVLGERYSIDPLDGSKMIHWTLDRLGRKIDFLHYQPILPPGQDTVIQVQYSHLVDVDMYGNNKQGIFQPYTWQFQYILRTSRNWSAFGPIQVRLTIPSNKYWYSMTLPMKFEGDSKGMDRFTYTLNGSEATENLLISLVESSGPMLNRSQEESFARTCWKRYLADPNDPFADDLLIRIAKDLMDRLDDSGSQFWIDALGVSQQQLQGRRVEEVIACAALNKIQQKYHDRYLESRLLARLFPLIRTGATYNNLLQIQNHFNQIKSQEWAIYTQEYLKEHKQQPDPDNPEQLAEAHRWSNAYPLFTDLPRLCDQYLSGFEQDEGFQVLKDRSKRYQAVMAQAEMEYRLSAAHNLDQRRWHAVNHDYPKFWALYENYKDLPESVELLKLLERGKSHPSSYKYKEMDQPFMVDLWRKVDQEIQKRNINVDGFPSSLGE